MNYMEAHGIGQRIKNIRLSLGETMEEFGAHFNTSKATVHNWEKERNKPNKASLYAIAKIADITVDELLYGKTDYNFSNLFTGVDFDKYKNKNIEISPLLHNIINSLHTNDALADTLTNIVKKAVYDSIALKDIGMSDKEKDFLIFELSLRIKTELMLSGLDKTYNKISED